jgi:hypothetical protein
MVRALIAIALYVAATAVSAQQQIGSPVSSATIEPAAPAAGQHVRLVLQFADCAVPTPGTNSIVVTGNTITFSQLVVPPLCGVPPPQPPVAFDIGVFQPGSYTLVYAPTTGSQTFAWTPLQRGFTVGPASVPAYTPIGLGALALAALLLALHARARRAAS